jgi:hypothetical protein
VLDRTSGLDDGREFLGRLAASNMKGIDGGEVLGSERIEVGPRLLERPEYPIAEATESVVGFNLLADGAFSAG